nr:small RNA 2'-O-methyltransferase-like [Pelodiscus sinensis]|eukprot:XP_025038736.1 small RNA 2'-O-methyltransferase-like [Pelodiscus sinensis]
MVPLPPQDDGNGPISLPSTSRPPLTKPRSNPSPGHPQAEAPRLAPSWLQDAETACSEQSNLWHQDEPDTYSGGSKGGHASKNCCYCTRAIHAATHYDYTVEFTGLGIPPPGTEDVGFCTQIGVFMRNHPKNGETVSSEKHTKHAYKTVFKAVYPSLKDEKYLQNAVVNEVIFGAEIIKRRLLGNFKSERKKHNETKLKFQPFKCCMRCSTNLSLAETEKCAADRSTEPFVDGNKVCIPLAKIFLIPKVNQLCGTFEKLNKLIAGKVALNSDGSAVIVTVENENEEQEY